MDYSRANVTWPNSSALVQLLRGREGQEDIACCARATCRQSAVGSFGLHLTCQLAELYVFEKQTNKRHTCLTINFGPPCL